MEVPVQDSDDIAAEVVQPPMVLIDDVPKPCPLTRRIRPVVSESSNEPMFPTEVDLLPHHI